MKRKEKTKLMKLLLIFTILETFLNNLVVKNTATLVK